MIKFKESSGYELVIFLYKKNESPLTLFGKIILFPAVMIISILVLLFEIAIRTLFINKSGT